MKKIISLILAYFFMQLNASADDVNVTADIITNTTWSSSNTYILSDYIFVADGATLTIQAGTKIKAIKGTGSAAPALIVTQGAKINAVGTAANPIVFTSVEDTGSNLTKDDKGKWGGLIILGKAPINSNGSSKADNTPLTNTIEGVPTISGITNRSIPASYATYGGTDHNDSSGTLQYVSIRHGGAEIGAGNEINGLTLGGVGAKTTIDHIEVFANEDDGIEFFGGSVNAKYLSVAYVGDDSFDFDEGYNGQLQFLLSIQDENSNRAIEWDGSTESDFRKADTSALPDYSAPVIANMTAIGIGKDGTSNHEDNNVGIEIRDNAGGQVWNSIVTEFAKSILDIEATDSTKGTQSTVNPATYGSQALLENGILAFKGNLFYNGGKGNTASGVAEDDQAAADIIFASDNNNTFSTDPLLTDVDDANGTISPFPKSSSPALTGAMKIGETDKSILDKTTFLTQTTFRGAFSNTNNWLDGWTLVDEKGITATLFVDPGSGTSINVNDNISVNTNWSATNTYILKDYIFVEPGATLTIEAGTTIKADVGSGDSAPALIITQGAKINAAGTAAKPIVFTSILDTGSGTKDQKGLWGGLIILGNAPINSNGKSNADNTPLTNAIEGVPTTSGISGKSILPAYATYGGTDHNDSSGTLQYVSIRHGGAEIGAGNEINGLTLGGVGAKTTIDHIEVFANKDDGIEFFGGSVNAKYLTVAYVGDDSFDFDEGYNGQLQFLLSIQDENSNRAIEWDGSTEADDRKADTSTLPDYSSPIIANMTAVGIGKDGTSNHEDNNVGLEIRDNAGGQVWNSIVTEFAKSILDIEDTDSSKGTASTTGTGNYGSQALLESGLLAFKGNLFYNGGKGNTALGTAEDDQAAADIIFASANNNSFSSDPALSDVDDSDGSLAPFPTASSPALTGAMKIGDTNKSKLDKSTFLAQTTFRGAFAAGSNWNDGWTKISSAGILGSTPSFGTLEEVSSDITTNTTWEASKTYLLKDYIFVANGATLTIEPGTTIKADQGTGDAAPALIVTQGAKINATGTAAKPIVFTSILDTGSGTKDQKGLWGGLILLGNAPINSNGKNNADNNPLTNAIEGVPTTSGISGRTIPAAYATYGGTDHNDSSGTLQYVSIRHGGAEIGAGNEINGLTLGGVGAKTTIDHIEVFANKDDGIEFFGGSVNAKYLTVAYVGDDSFDFDEGYNGHLQFLLSIQDENSNRAIEWDGSTESDDLNASTSILPSWSAPVIANMTAIGIGKDGTSNHEDNNVGLEIRDNAGGQVWNSIVTEFAKSILDIEATDSAKGTKSTVNSGTYGSQALLENGILAFKGNLFYNGGKGNTALGTAEDDQAAADIIFASANNNSFDVDPKLTDVDDADGSLAPFPTASSPALTGAESLTTTSFLAQVSFQGAFSASNNWLDGWTKLDSAGIVTGPIGSGSSDFTNVTTDITSDTTWVASETYLLKDYIFVAPGATLTIEPGTTIKADQGTGDAAPALIVTQGATINAAGTADKPIVFTSILDTGSGTKDQKGLWGGLIILGNAPINSNGKNNSDNSPLTNAIEGVPTTSGISGRSIPASYATYGGNDHNDSSGTLQYISIRHGGAEIGAGNEINGLTLGGVGAKTTIDHIEVFANKDDGIEFFGGSVNAKYLTVAYVGDDSFDFDEGYNGHLQFLLSIQDENSNRAIEWDGSTESDDRKADTSTLPDYSAPVIANMTAIGIGKDGTSNHEDNNVGLEIRDNAGGQVWNSIVTEFAKSIIDIEDTDSSKGTQSTVNSGTYGSQALLENGILAFKGNLFYNGGKGNTALGTAEDNQAAADVIFASANNNSFDVNPALSDVDDSDKSIAPFPTASSPALTGAETLGDTSFISQTVYRGAFAAGSNWNDGWTKISQAGILGSTPSFGTMEEVSADITSDTKWVSSKTYLLKDYIFVASGATLTIEPGTTIKADQGTGDAAPALIVTQGAKINAVGTATKPIVFTSILDTGSGTKDQKGLWGGLIILGNAPINSNGKSNPDNSPLTNTIEGVPTTSGISGRSIPASYATYGGTDESDDSGVLKYVSIRHGGAEIGAGNEINGLTLGGVGNGTTIDHIEVFANKDDGIEFFGGSVNAKYLTVAYVGDDSFDFDEGYNGQLQFLLSIQDENSNRAIEWDGSTESDDRKADNSTLPDYSAPVIANLTAIGIGKDGTSNHEDNNVGLEIRDNAGGQVWNSIVTEFAKSILDIEATDSAKGTQSTVNTATYGSQALLENGTLAFKGNLFYNGGKGNTALGTAEDDQAAADVIFASANNNSFDVDPKLTDVDDADGSLSPFFVSGSPALTGAETLTDTSFLAQVSYRGAFSEYNNWLEGWSKLDSAGIVTGPSGSGSSDFTNVTTDITSDTTWVASETYLLKDYIFIANGATLTIEPGTTIKADQGTGDAAPALIVTQGAKINAAGTAAKPIVFTSILDTGSGTKDQKGLWGGLIILGNAPINSNGKNNPDNSPLTNAIEGVPTTSGISGRSIPASYATYGGNDEADDSGVLQYVSIRHGGAEIGAGNEINGLTLGGVGNGTTIDHIEVFANKDDGIEFFGGSVNAKYLVVAFVGDDSFDFDEGYNGNLQFLLSIQDENSNRAIEWDGSTESDDLKADTSIIADWSEPVIANMTAIGNGKDRTSNHEDNNVGLEIRDNAGGQVWNSIFTEFSKSIGDIEATDSPKGTQSTISENYGSQALLENGILAFKGNLFYNGGKGNTALGTWEDDQDAADIIFQPVNNNSFDVDPKLAVVKDTRDTGLGAVSPHPYSDSPALSNASTLPQIPFLTQTSYRGAFDGFTDWTTWTKSTSFAYIASLTSDFDQESLSLGQEISSTYLTDPTLSDTDGDGFDDAIDSDPRDPDQPGTAPVTGTLKGISTNAMVTPDALMVAGVTITGGTKKVVFQVQATGTYAATDGYLQDPILYVVNASTGAIVATVDNWQNGPDAGYDASLYIPSYLTELQNSAYAMTGANEAAIIMNLPEGSYTALVGSKSGTETAKAVVAAFDFETGATIASLKGISTNASVTPEALMVAGVTVTGGTKKVVFQVQATGTYAATDGYLQDPILYVVNASTGAIVATVDNWQNGPDAGYDANLYIPSYLTELQNSAYAMTGANEAAIIMNLPEGSYTALVGSKSGTESGKAVVAAFDFE